MNRLAFWFFKNSSDIHEGPHVQRVKAFLNASLPIGAVSGIPFGAFMWYEELPLFALVPWTISVLYFFCIFLIQKNRLHLALFISQATLLLFIVLGVFFAGWDSGLYLWFLFQVVLVLAGYRWKTWFKGLQIGAGILAVLFSALVLGPQPPYYSLPADNLEAIYNLNVASVLLINVVIVFVLFRATENAEEEAFEAHQETRSLLLNILPESIADRLAENPTTIADSIDEASILFADLVGFTALSADKAAADVVTILNGVFYEFDSIVERLGLEKIKTIGDGYMAAAGVPIPREDHALAAVHCAAQLLQSLRKFNQEHGTNLGVRIGINSGPIVAGVIGKNKFTYDLWGDTVNTASRMESNGSPGRIQVSERTHALVRTQCKFEERGEIQIKGKGAMKTFFVTGIRTSALL